MRTIEDLLFVCAAVSAIMLVAGLVGQWVASFVSEPE